MIRTFGKLKVYVAVISHKRPENIDKIQSIVGEATFFVNRGEKKAYSSAQSVVECGDNICQARNKAIEKANGFPCIQVSDDLKGIVVASVDRKTGKKTFVPETFRAVVVDMVGELKRTGLIFGGVAVSSNRLNYTGKDYSYQNLIVNDLICIMPSTIRFDNNVALKEDYDMTIQQLLFMGGVVRCNHILCNFPHRENKGGANTYRNSESELQATEKLKDKWGDLIKDHPTRSGQVALNYKAVAKVRENYLQQLRKQ